MHDDFSPAGTDRRALLKTAGLALASTFGAQANAASTGRAEGRGIPGARNVDHAGSVVPDLEEAVRFFVDVVGADLLFRSPPAAGLESKEEAAPGTTVAVAFLRFGPNLNLELLQFIGPRAPTPAPRVSENGAVHIAIWVDDVVRAADYLRAQPGVEIIGGVGEPSSGADKGTTWVYAPALRRAPRTDQPARPHAL